MDEKEVLNQAMKFPLDPVLARYARDQNLEAAVVQEHERELRRFLALVAIGQQHGSKSYAMRGPIDELWHTFVTFTKVYADFCGKLGGGFIHHFPNTEAPTRPQYAKDTQSAAPNPLRASLGESYRAFLQRYEEVFKEPPPVHLWPRPHKDEMAEYTGAGCGCVCSCGCSCIA